ncbi:acyl-CoA synthetase [Sphingobium sp. JS3065]|uniref:acyl-CoA synthetase n=1 Tax=Sphingobium sp. JS3065 TaxID=2970925 RepID=UPI00226539B3|nr:acyl-CoA synthetase [Sphingobium sp. JS3065]UZW56395.1 acyl-CoA synthetase [Sphingobium sp. JS3065]
MHPSQHAATTPEKPAYIMLETGETVTYAELDARSNQGAHLLRKIGLRTGDGIAIFLENHPRYFEILWAAQRSGLRFTCLSSKLSPDEVEYIVRDSEAKVVVTSKALVAETLAITSRLPGVSIQIVGEAVEGYPSFEAGRAEMPTSPIADESAGRPMLYSSGTTGRPKGVKRAGILDPDIAAPHPQAVLGKQLYGWNADIVYLCPAPLYHAAPMNWSMAVHTLGGTVILMERFDAEKALEAIERYKVTTSQWVPTHFIRMLKLPEEVRKSFDLSSLTNAFHAAAPCPVHVKQQMLAWWGPIIHEYYGGTEGNGFCAIGPAEWATHPGSVGRSVVGRIRICDDQGEPLPVNSEGLIYFENGRDFEYHGDPEKTAQSRNAMGWTTIGDVGRVDEDGYLYLTDRKSFMIISGGVNIYPQEIENVLIEHPQVADVAVVGAPHEEFGEQVVAVVQPANWADATPALAAELIQWVRDRLSHVKTPKRVDFMPELPRHATGKLHKREIREQYWKAEDGRRL